MTLSNKILIVTTTAPGNRFPENFSCWCAGALEAKGMSTELEVLELFQEPMSRALLKTQEVKRDHLQQLLPTIDKLVLTLPMYHKMLPAGLDSFVQLLANKKSYKTCKLITIGMEPVNSSNETAFHAGFNYPLEQLYTLFGPMLSTSPTQIQNSPTGNMCPLFAQSYDALCLLIQEILGLGDYATHP